jgi:DNA-binding beta-propeller fold protein YncE
MLKALLTICMLLATQTFFWGPRVITVPAKLLNGPNGFALDARMNLYVANETGKFVSRLSKEGKEDTVLISDSPSGLAFDEDQHLLVSNFFSGSILRISKNRIDTVAKGLEKPSDIHWFNNELYVSLYDQGSIIRINSNGEINVYAKGLDHPFGLAFDVAGNCYVANNSGLINQVTPDGRVKAFAKMPSVISYIAYSAKTERLYVPCFSNHNIYFVTANGNVVHLAGGESGYRDGSLENARFTGPNSVAITVDGDLYLSEHASQRIRKIEKVE